MVAGRIERNNLYSPDMIGSTRAFFEARPESCDVFSSALRTLRAIENDPAFKNRATDTISDITRIHTGATRIHSPVCPL